MKVKELVDLLRTHDQEAEIVSTGVDCGGYDYVITRIIVVMATNNQVYVGGIHETGDMRKKAFKP